MTVVRPSLQLLLLLTLAGCAEKTGALTPEEEQQFASEGILRRGDDLVFRYTRGSGTRDAFWEDRKASIVVTKLRVYIHKNQKVGLEITPRTRRFVQVRREGNRVRINAGGGRSTESWSFIPPSDPEGWAGDIRAVLNANISKKARATRCEPPSERSRREAVGPWRLG
jgi:hypothetical protein